jgi:nicotinate-nucleotide pyrophosphorylase (carboxylating)
LDKYITGFTPLLINHYHYPVYRRFLSFAPQNYIGLNTQEFIAAALKEDIGSGDHSTLASISPDAMGKAVLKVKEAGILAGVQLAQDIFHYLEPQAAFTIYKNDGDKVAVGDIAFEVSAKVHTILQAERLSLNCMQRMSGIATLTNEYVTKLKPYKTKILDTRKTTPLFREYEKWAVKIGGGENHRMGLYDMVMLKDNHIDFCGGIEKAIEKTNQYLKTKNLDLKIEVETRSIDDVKRVLAVGGVHRIMLDNYTPEQLAEAVTLINGKYETEASGGITIENIEAYAKTGVDYISVGAIIHHAVSMDLSLKAQLS